MFEKNEWFTKTATLGSLDYISVCESIFSVFFQFDQQTSRSSLYFSNLTRCLVSRYAACSLCEEQKDYRFIIYNDQFILFDVKERMNKVIIKDSASVSTKPYMTEWKGWCLINSILRQNRYSYPNYPQNQASFHCMYPRRIGVPYVNTNYYGTCDIFTIA